MWYMFWQLSLLLLHFRRLSSSIVHFFTLFRELFLGAPSITLLYLFTSSLYALEPCLVHLSISNCPIWGGLYGLQLRILCSLTHPMCSLHLFLASCLLDVVDYKEIHLDIPVAMVETMIRKLSTLSFLQTHRFLNSHTFDWYPHLPHHGICNPVR